jgi:hypothetical protein
VILRMMCPSCGSCRPGSANLPEAAGEVERCEGPADFALVQVQFVTGQEISGLQCKLHSYWDNHPNKRPDRVHERLNLEPFEHDLRRRIQHRRSNLRR